MNNAYLYIEDRKYSVKNFSFDFMQPQGINLKPSAKTQGGKFRLTLEESKDLFLSEWTIDPRMMKKGYVEVADFTIGKIAFRWEFANAFAVDQVFDYSAHSNEPARTMIEITAGIVRINRELIFENTWNPNNPFEEGEVTVIERELEPRMVSLRYTDMEGNEIQQLYDDKLILEIKTENCIGKLVDIDLSDDEFDFIYKGEHLENDLIEDLEIVSDIQKLELEVFFEIDEDYEEEDNETIETAEA